MALWRESALSEVALEVKGPEKKGPQEKGPSEGRNPWRWEVRPRGGHPGGRGSERKGPEEQLQIVCLTFEKVTDTNSKVEH